ncbi:MAG TPA: diacylglycerol kinase family protein [Flavisolibacter sp.]
MTSRKFSVRERGNSFAYAWAGIRTFFNNEHNARIHLALTVAAVAGGFLLDIARSDWMILIVVIAMVWAAELFNTALEKIMDFVSPGKHPQVKMVKDLSAAAVLVSALAAVISGCIIFLPKILK